MDSNMLNTLTTSNSYRQTLNTLGHTLQYTPFDIESAISQVHSCNIFWSYNIPHSVAGPQNISATSTVQLDATVKFVVIRGDNQQEFWVLQNDAGTADILYQNTVRIDPNNTTDNLCVRTFNLQCKNRKARNEQTGEIIDDASTLLSNMTLILIALYHNVASPNNALGAGVTNTNIGNLFIDYSVFVNVFGQYSS